MVDVFLSLSLSSAVSVVFGGTFEGADAQEVDGAGALSKIAMGSNWVACASSIGVSHAPSATLRLEATRLRSVSVLFEGTFKGPDSYVRAGAGVPSLRTRCRVLSFWML